MNSARFLALLLVMICLSFAFHPQVFADAPPPSERAAALASPATVFIENDWSATITYPFEEYVYHDATGLFTMTAHPEEGTFTHDVPLLIFSGSGFVVTPDGYIVTNAHVATDQLDKISWISGMAVDSTNALLQSGDIQESQYDAYLVARYNFLMKYATWTGESNKLYVALSTVSATSGTSLVVLTADLKIAGEVSGGTRETINSDKDVAIIKVNAPFSLPTVPVGDSSQVAVGQQVYVIGYPGMQGPVTGFSSIAVPTVTAGIVSAFKDMPFGGWQAIQTDAQFHHGNSGGPALDTNGNVIGLATWGSWDPNSPSLGELSGINFLVPINIAKEYLNQANIQPRRGDIDKYWDEGLDLFWNNHYSAAVGDFQQVLNIYPGDPYATRYIQQAQQAITAGKDVPILFGISGLSWTIVGAAIAVVAVVVIAGILLTRRHRRMPEPEQATVTEPTTAAASDRIFCTNCGSPLPPGSAFCRKCGTKQVT